MCLAAVASARPLPANCAETALARFVRVANAPRYVVRIETHDERGDRTEDAAFRYRHAPDASELDVLEGRGAGVRMTLVAGTLTVYGASVLPGIGRRVPADDPGVTSLRGNGVAAADLGTIASCFVAHAASIREVPGMPIDREPTTQIVFDRRGATCPNDSRADRAITRDVVFVSAATGVPLMRKRLVDREIVEQWRFRDFAIVPADARQ